VLSHVLASKMQVRAVLCGQIRDLASCTFVVRGMLCCVSTVRASALSDTFHAVSAVKTESGSSTLRSTIGLLRKSFFWAWLDTICQYRRSRIGPFWETVNVLVSIGGLAVVYSAIFGGNIVAHLGYIGAGVIIWSAINAMVMEGCQTFLRYRMLITTTNIDVAVYVARTVLRIFITFAHHLVIYFLALALRIVPLTWISLLSLVGIALVFANGFWLVTVLAFVCARFRDVQLIVRNLLQLAFFVTPVFWDYHQVAASQRYILDFNVLFHFLQIVREPLLGNVPSTQSYLVVTAVTGTGAALTYLVRRRMQPELAFFV
jgi:ABC-type polysaccharide/polyol phosphate export permease